MSGYYLCQSARARRPFYIESIGIHIYSLEELCYYLRENVYLIDETILNQKLCQWLGAELGLVKLQKILLRALEKGEDSVGFTLPLFQECGYIKGQELQYFKEQLLDIQVEAQDVRRKMKADYLVSYGMYVSAIEDYEKILDKRAGGRLGIQFYASVWEGMAAAYAKMFRFEEAAGCLWESYQTLRSKKVYENYLRLLPLYLSEQAYYDRLTEIKADRSQAARLKEDTLEILQEGINSPYAKEWENTTEKEQIQRLKKEYTRIR